MSYCVLTGDIINSTDMTRSDLDRALSSVEASVAAISRWNGATQTGFARRGGDAWQAVIGDASLDLRAMLFIAANLTQDGAIRSRIAAARSVSKLEPDDLQDPNRAHGRAFTASGRLVSKLPAHHPFGHANDAARDAAIILAAEIAKGWTQAQARAVTLMLSPERMTQSQVAGALGISRPAVQQALAGAGYSAIDRALRVIETADDDS